jgi:hypothetical protein
MSDPRIVALLIAVIAVAIYAVIVFVGLRALRQRFALALMLAAAIVVFVPIAAWGIARGELAIWHFAAFFACGVAAIVFLYGAVSKSLSLQMLGAIAQTPGHSVTTQRLAAEIIGSAFTGRIQLLEGARLIERSAQGFMLTPTGLSTAARIRKLQRAFRIDSSPLYSG